MITRDMRRTLVEDLNYSLKDVNKLKPEEAMEIISKGIRSVIVAAPVADWRLDRQGLSIYLMTALAAFRNPMKDFRRPGTTASGDD